MAWEENRNGNGRARHAVGAEKRALRGRKKLVQLLCALVIFSVCWVSVRYIPGLRNRAAPILENLLTCSCDFEEAVRCFSARMEKGDDVGTALEDFCVTAFAVQTVHDAPRDSAQTSYIRLALREALACPETSVSGF